MPVIFTRQTSEKTHELRSAFKHDNVTRDFLIFLLENGYLNRLEGLFNPERLRKGKVPKGFDIHHIIPLSGGGSNSLSNLCLIEKSFHKFLNRRCFDPALKNIQEGETVQIDIPDLPPVALYSDFKPFIHSILSKRERHASFRRIILRPLLIHIPFFKDWQK